MAMATPTLIPVIWKNPIWEISKESTHYVHLTAGAVANTPIKEVGTGWLATMLNLSAEIYPAAFILFAVISLMIGLTGLIVKWKRRRKYRRDHKEKEYDVPE